MTVVFASGSATIHAVHASRYVPRCRGVTGGGRSDHRSARFGMVVCMLGSYHTTTVTLKTDEKNGVGVASCVHRYGTMENCVTYRVSVFGS